MVSAIATLLGVWVDGPLADGVPSQTAMQVDWPRGTIGSIVLNLIDNDGQPVDLDLAGTDRLELSLRQTYGSDPSTRRLASKVAGGGLGSYQFDMVRTDTLDVFTGRMIFDVWVTRGSAERQVVSPGYFNISPRMRAP